MSIDKNKTEKICSKICELFISSNVSALEGSHILLVLISSVALEIKEDLGEESYKKYIQSIIFSLQSIDDVNNLESSIVLN